MNESNALYISLINLIIVKKGYFMQFMDSFSTEFYNFSLSLHPNLLKTQKQQLCLATYK